MKTLKFMLLLGALFLPIVCHAESVQIKPKFRVRVSIDTKSSQQSEAASYVKRELRSLNDVEVTDSKALYTISLIVMTIQNKTKDILGVAVSWVVFRQEYEQSGLIAPIQGLSDHQLWTGSQDDLQRFCRELVAQFDTEVLDTERKLFSFQMDAALFLGRALGYGEEEIRQAFIESPIETLKFLRQKKVSTQKPN